MAIFIIRLASALLLTSCILSAQAQDTKTSLKRTSITVNPFSTLTWGAMGPTVSHAVTPRLAFTLRGGLRGLHGKEAKMEEIPYATKGFYMALGGRYRLLPPEKPEGPPRSWLHGFYFQGLIGYTSYTEKFSQHALGCGCSWDEVEEASFGWAEVMSGAQIVSHMGFTADLSLGAYIPFTDRHPMAAFENRMSLEGISWMCHTTFGFAF